MDYIWIFIIWIYFIICYYIRPQYILYSITYCIINNLNFYLWKHLYYNGLFIRSWFCFSAIHLQFILTRIALLLQKNIIFVNIFKLNKSKEHSSFLEHSFHIKYKKKNHLTSCYAFYKHANYFNNFLFTFHYYKQLIEACNCI